MSTEQTEQQDAVPGQRHVPPAETAPESTSGNTSDETAESPEDVKAEPDPQAEETKAEETKAEETQAAETTAEEEKAARQQSREEKKAAKDEQRQERAAAARAGVEALRTRIAQAIRVVTLVIALILAVAALLVALRHSVNEQNPLVQTMTDLARFFDGPFSLRGGVFAFTGKHALIKEALLNWGIAALVYLVVGRIVSKVVHP